MELISADVIRDGGSLTACFDRDGRDWSLWLKVAPWRGQAGPTAYRTLHLSADLSPERGRAVALGSEAEQEIFRQLDAWLGRPSFAASALEPCFPGQSAAQRREAQIALVAQLRADAETRLG